MLVKLTDVEERSICINVQQICDIMEFSNHIVISLVNGNKHDVNVTLEEFISACRPSRETWV